jgi:hypothetical protein
MSQYGCVVEWSREGSPFSNGKYSRGHDWRFDGGAAALHHAAHEHCYIASTLHSTVRVEGGWHAAKGRAR